MSPNPQNPQQSCGVPPSAAADPCAGNANGTIFYCKDGKTTALPPPIGNAVLEFDPVSGQPYWNTIPSSQPPKKP